MKKLLLGIILISFVNCNSQKIKLNGLKDCLVKKDIKILEDGLANFESVLKGKYPELGREESYIKFLKDFMSNNIPPNFFLNSEIKSINERIEEIEIWQLIQESDEGLEAKIRLDGSEPELTSEILTLKNEFQKCLITKTSNDGIKNFLALRTKVSGLSWQLTARYIFDRINEKDLKDEMNRLIIALGIYYEFSLNLKK